MAITTTAIRVAGAAPVRVIARGGRANARGPTLVIRSARPQQLGRARRFRGGKHSTETSCRACPPPGKGRRFEDVFSPATFQQLADLDVDSPFMTDITSRLFDEFADMAFGTAGASKAASSAFPVNVFQRESEYILTAELPGLSEADVTLKMEGRTLTISAAKEETKETETGQEEKGLKVLRVERRARKFHRAFRMPKDVDDAAITALMENGVLTLTMPRLGLEKPAARTIAVQKGQPSLSSGVDVETEGKKGGEPKEEA